MTQKSIGPWPLGIDMLSELTSMPRDRNGRAIAARESINGDFTRDGWWGSRPGFARILSQSGMHSAWAHDDGRAYGALGAQLLRLNVNAVGQLTTSAIAALPSAAPLDFDECNREILVSSRDYIGVISINDVVRALAPPDASLPAVTAVAGGGLSAGRYSVAISIVTADGQEGGLSPIHTLEIPEGGGLRLVLPSLPSVGNAPFARVYRTEANGSMIYVIAHDVPLSLGTYIVGSGTLGRAADTQYLRGMLPGSIVRHWKGRVWTAQGRLLRFSEPMRHGLMSTRHNTIQFPRPITFIEGVEGGLFVGQTDGVIFLRGTNPKNFEFVRTGGAPPVPRSSRRITSDFIDPQLQIEGECALWLAENGYVLGLASGQISEPQSQRIRVPVAAPGRTAIIDRRAITIVT